MWTLFVIIFCIFGYTLIGGVIKGINNAFCEPSKRHKSYLDEKFIMDVILWPAWILILLGFGILKTAERAALVTEDKVKDFRNIETIKSSNAIEGEVDTIYPPVLRK